MAEDKKLSEKLQKIVDEVEKLTVLEVSVSDLRLSYETALEQAVEQVV